MSEQKEKKSKRFYGRFFYFCRCIWHITHRRQPVYGLENIVEEPAVFIGRHQNLHGPVEIMAWSPMRMRVWALHVFLNVRTCYRHFSGYTFSVRKGWSHFLAKLTSAIISPFVVGLLRSMKAIPVYRAQKNIMDTFRQSVQTLCAGENILMMPERDYTDRSADAGDMYNGFVHIAQMYYRASGRALHFYAIYPSQWDNAIYINKPVVFDPQAPFRAERERVVAALKESLSYTNVEREFSA